LATRETHKPASLLKQPWCHGKREIQQRVNATLLEKKMDYQRSDHRPDNE
jgi:hypothetical protein